ncbi:MAG: ROK family protein [Ferruginibacter sp.]
MKILTIDIGGSHIKMTLLDGFGKMQKDYLKENTPSNATPAEVLEVIKSMELHFPGYNRISAGFPGYVKNGVILSAPNLGTKSWKDPNFEKLLTATFGKPAKVLNDADMQGLGIASGEGFEMVVTLGTGFGTALLKDGKLIPHFELSHHPISKNKIYDKYIGDMALKKKGKKKWNKRLKKILLVLKTGLMDIYGDKIL